MGKGKGVFWFLYVCALGIGFSKTTASLTRMMGLPVSAYFLLTAALIIAVLLLIYLPGKLLAGKFGSGTKKSAKPGGLSAQGERPFMKTGRMGLAGWSLLLLLLGALVCVRLFLAPDMGDLSGQDGSQGAVMRMEQSSLFLSLPGLYARFLTSWISLFGADCAVFLCNLALQVLGFVFLYVGIFVLAGRVCACTALICIIYLPVFHNSAYMAEAQSLRLFFFGAALWSCALCVRSIGKSASEKKPSVLPAMAAGAVCGAAAGMDLLLCSLLFLFGAYLFLCRERKGTARLFICYFLTALCVFLLSLCFNGSYAGQDLLETAAQWLAGGSSREHDAILHSPSLTDLWLTLPVYLVAFLPVFGVLEQDRTGIFAWIFSFLAVMAAELMGNAPLQEQGMRFVFLGVMAGFGILQTLAVPVAQKEQMPERQRISKGGPEVIFMEETGDSLQEGTKEKMAEQNERMNEEKKAFGEEEGRPLPGTWLDNPLPVPKKHVKKEMGYGFEPDPDQMFFDIPVSDQDDFDI